MWNMIVVGMRQGMALFLVAVLISLHSIPSYAQGIVLDAELLESVESSSSEMIPSVSEDLPQDTLLPEGVPEDTEELLPEGTPELLPMLPEDYESMQYTEMLVEINENLISINTYLHIFIYVLIPFFSAILFVWWFGMYIMRKYVV